MIIHQLASDYKLVRAVNSRFESLENHLLSHTPTLTCQTFIQLLLGTSIAFDILSSLHAVTITQTQHEHNNYN